MTARRDSTEDTHAAPRLSDRQETVLRSVIAAYVGDGVPVASQTLAHLLPVRLSSASIRNTLAQLATLGFVEKPHASAGRVPTERGMRFYVDRLLDPRELNGYEKRDLAGSIEEVGSRALMRAASQLLSERTRQLGFVVLPRLDRLVLQRVRFVRVTTRRLLVVIVSQTGAVEQRVVADDGEAGQAELERMGSLLNERFDGKTLREVRDHLAHQVFDLRSQADGVLARAIDLGARALAGEEGDLVIASWLALLDQPEFQDWGRIRQLLEAVETRERLVSVLDEILPERGVGVAFGDEMGDPSLRDCALVAAPYGDEQTGRGVLGVIGPRRMDFSRVIPLVEYVSGLVTERLEA